MQAFKIGGMVLLAGLLAMGAYFLLLREPNVSEAPEALPLPPSEEGPPKSGPRGEMSRLPAQESGAPQPSTAPNREPLPPLPPPAENLVAVQWTPVYVSPNPIDRSVFLETIKPDTVAASLLLADRAACIPELCGFGCGVGLIPKHAVAWQERDPSIPRRVIVEGRIAARKGYLEHFLSIFEAGKDHESIVSASFDAQSLHVGLLALGLKPGKPAQFFNEKREEAYKPATGDRVRVDVEYLRDGRWVRQAAQEWVVHSETKKPLEADWVFAGSYFGEYEGDDGKPMKYYAANGGRVICLTNFGSALLDIPVRSADGNPEEGLEFVANTDVIPPRGTPVRIILEPKK